MGSSIGNGSDVASVLHPIHGMIYAYGLPTAESVRTEPLAFGNAGRLYEVHVYLSATTPVDVVIAVLDAIQSLFLSPLHS